MFESLQHNINIYLYALYITIALRIKMEIRYKKKLMLLTTLIMLPIIGIISILLLNSYDKSDSKILLKIVALVTTLLNLIVSLIV